MTNLNETLQQAIACQQAGQNAEAERLYRAVLQAQPNHPDVNHNLGVLVGKADGLRYLKTALEAEPTRGQFWLSYADALLAAGQAKEALLVMQTAMQCGLDSPAAESLQKKAELAALADSSIDAQGTPDRDSPPQEKSDVTSEHERPRVEKSTVKNGKPAKKRGSVAKFARPQKSLPQAVINQLITLFNAGRYKELEGHTRLLIGQYPDFGFIWKALGISLQMQGKDALLVLQKAVELLPDDAEMHNNLGNALRDIGRLDGALASFRRALEIMPGSAEMHSNMGNVLRDFGQHASAATCFRRALALKPGLVEAYNNLGNVQRDLGQFDGAVNSFRRALELKPDFAEAYNNLGNVQRELGQLAGAMDSYRRALENNPDFAEAYSNLGNAQRAIGQLAGAMDSYQRALEITPDFAEAYCNLGAVLKDLGQLDGAMASYRRSLEIKPDFAEAYSNLLFLYSYHALIDPNEYLAQARGWELACVPAQDRQAAHDRSFQRPPLTGRRLRVGYVSGDYRQHAVSYFIEQLFAHHDRARIELFAYSTQGQRDAVTERLKAMAEHWVQLAGITDAAICARIEADDIDVLIDLSGHTVHCRLGVFARRVAPVQAHYLGFMASTGLIEMDYWVGDEILTPAETDRHFSERVWRLPRVWVCYDGKADAPVPAWRPTRDGVVWLGSFNNLGKLTTATLTLWARVLHALPEGKLLLKTKELNDIGNRQRILDAMAAHGILPNRIELQGSSATPDWSAHMAYYDRLDIALDPVGAVGGGTTTCDALWMGVPVVTLEGDRMASRMTASMLSAIGHSEWIARSDTEYIDKVVALARDMQQRKALRSDQRKRMAASPLCDAQGLARSLEHAYVEMFERWLDEKN